MRAVAPKKKNTVITMSAPYSNIKTITLQFPQQCLYWFNEILRKTAIVFVKTTDGLVFVMETQCVL
jgi:hypothetical protein